MCAGASKQDANGGAGNSTPAARDGRGAVTGRHARLNHMQCLRPMGIFFVFGMLLEWSVHSKDLKEDHGWVQESIYSPFWDQCPFLEGTPRAGQLGESE